ncbi:MAG TPA: hypothetical protein VGB69_09680, partial [Edaphobacter sp.]
MNSSPTLLKKCVAAAIFSVVVLAGCSKSKQDQAVEQAKQQATATGQPQQVVSTDKDGNTVTTVVQPPQPGQKGQQITTTVTPPAPGAAANAPAVAGGAPAQNEAMTAAQGAGNNTAPSMTPVAPADVRIPAGTTLAIRINQHISVKTSHPGDRFDGEIVDPVMGENGELIVPKGTVVGGVVAASHKRGHFKGASILQLRLTSMTLDGTSYPLATSSLTRTKKGKGKRSFGFIGGGTGLGMLIGGVA